MWRSIFSALMRIQVKRNVAVELCVLAALTCGFLLVFPQRPMFADAGLALFALMLLALNARYTKHVIWGQFPSASPRRFRVRKTCLFVGSATGVVVMGMFATGLALGYIEGGWDTAEQRVGNWRVLVALVLYLPWALLQQTLFQFYLLGRLLTLFPAGVAVAVTGIAYGLVHLPDIGIAAVTVVAGVFWTAVYYRYRVLTPLALSHALLGPTFYYWVYGQDLAKEWVGGW